MPTANPAPNTTRVPLEDLFDRYKGCPQELFALIEESEAFRCSIETALADTVKGVASRGVSGLDWRAVFLALIQNHVGYIWSPYIRRDAIDAILSEARKWRVTESQLELAIGIVPSMMEQLKLYQIDLPQGSQLEAGRSE